MGVAQNIGRVVISPLLIFNYQTIFMMKRTTTIFWCYLIVAALSGLTVPSYAQTPPTFEGRHLAQWDGAKDRPSTQVSGTSHQVLTEVITSYDLYTLDARAIDRYVKSTPESATFQLVLGEEYQWEIMLEENNLLSPDYQSFALTSQGKVEVASTPTVTFRGQLLSEGGGEVRLLLDGDQLQGFVTVNDKKIYLENLSNLSSGASTSQFVLYSEDAVKEEGELLCLAKQEQAYDKQIQDRVTDQAANGCEDQAELEIATLALFRRFNSAGSQPAVNNEILGILNNVQANYNQFSIKFNVVEQVVSTCSSCDPWTTTNPSSILREFTNWGSSGFSQRHDAGICFFDGAGSGTVGVAWVGAICTSSRYSVCDKLRTSESNRVLVAHEVGHNFSARHDASGSPFIMAPSVNTSSNWSSASTNAINNHISSRSCLSCVGGGGTPPPVACPVPTQLRAQNISVTTVSLNWRSAGSGNDYRLQYRRQGTSSWTSRNVGSSNASLSGLRANTTYQWRVRTICDNSNSDYISGPNFTTRPEDTNGCTAPTALVVNNIRTSTASFDWRSMNGARNYTFRIRSKGSSRWFSFNVSRSSIGVRGMRSGTTYQWQVRTNCSGGSSNYVVGAEFTTSANQVASATNNVVWSETFTMADNRAGNSAWTSRVTDANQGVAHVVDGRFTISNTSAEWQSEKINISELKEFELTYDIESIIAQDGGELTFYYRMDGGEWEEVDQQSEALERTSVIISGLATGEWLELRFVASTNSAKQVYYLDNIGVVCANCETETLSATSVLTSDDELVDVTVYPNPYYESFRIDLPSEVEQLSAQVFDLQGKLVQQEQYMLPKRRLELGKGLDPGLYVVRLSGSEFLRELKITKQE